MTTNFVDSNLYEIVDTAINTFQAKMKKLKGTKPDTVLLETEASELFMLSEVLIKQMPSQVIPRYGFGTLECNYALKELDQLSAKISAAIDQYQQKELALIHNNFFARKRHN